MLKRVSSDYYATISDLLKVSDIRKNFDRFGLGQRSKRSPGMEIVENFDKLMILGKPGSGKTTFLRHIAVSCSKGEFLPDHIPILIELREIDDSSNFNLFNEICQELELDNKEQTEQILKQNQFLFLLDGLDEVPSELRKTIQDNLRKFSKEYYKNRFIITCRTQTSEYRLDNFEYIEVADFDTKQIVNFVNNWFFNNKCYDNEFYFQEPNKLAKKFLEKLKYPDNKQIAELAVTPILLSLTCWVFSDSKVFPSKRAGLYKRGINLLLAKWDISRGIKRDSGSEIYRKMSISGRQEILSNIAFCKFEKQQYALFEEDEIQKYLVEFIQDKGYSNISTEEIKQLPKTIESQHGLIVERAVQIYSFSHLTFQEFLTAQYISNESRLVKQLAENHITDTRWREVFLLLAELKQADDLLLAMEQQIQTYINTPKLQGLLAWAEQIIDTSPTNIKPVGKRAIALANAVALLHGPNTAAYQYLDIFIKVLFRDNTYVYKNINALASSIGFIQAITYSSNNHYRNSSAIKQSLNKFIKYAQEAEKLTVYNKIDYDILVDKLKDLKEKIPDNGIKTKIKVNFLKNIISTVRSTFLLPIEKNDLSKEEFTSLENYFYANKLMIECKEAAGDGVSPETWNGIEERMFTNRGS